MGTTFSTDLPRPEGTTEAPCLCAQMGDGFLGMMRGEDSAEIRADLAQQADPGCPHCGGTGVENPPVASPHKLDLNMANGPALLAALGLSGDYGRCPIADARRALLRARNTNLGHLVREDETSYGAPCVQDDGTVELRPSRSTAWSSASPDLNHSFRVRPRPAPPRFAGTEPESSPRIKPRPSPVLRTTT